VYIDNYPQFEMLVNIFDENHSCKRLFNLKSIQCAPLASYRSKEPKAIRQAFRDLISPFKALLTLIEKMNRRFA
jgi:hypothetical protein